MKLCETCQTIEENSQNEPHSFLPLERVYKPTDISAFASVIRPTLSRTYVFANAYQLTLHDESCVRRAQSRTALDYVYARMNTRARHPRACTHARVNAWPRIFAAPPPVASANFTTRIAHARGTL